MERREREKEKISLRLLLVKGESSGERREEEWGREKGGEGKHTQTEPCLTSSLTERRKDWYKASATEQKRKRQGGRQGGRAEALNAKKKTKDRRRKKGWKRCTRAASVLVRKEQKTLCSWMGAGELNHKASAMRNQADFSHWCCWAPILSLSLPLSLCVCLCQLGLSLGMI